MYIKDLHTENALFEGPIIRRQCKWLTDLFQKGAVQIAEVHRKILEKIHGAQFERGEDVPSI